jgi:hypothetical protein
MGQFVRGEQIPLIDSRWKRLHHCGAGFTGDLTAGDTWVAVPVTAL